MAKISQNICHLIEAMNKKDADQTLSFNRVKFATYSAGPKGDYYFLKMLGNVNSNGAKSSIAPN